jgi:hypothetical protein
MPEEVQELGRQGAARVKRLLEGTLRFNLPYNAYSHVERVTLVMLTGAGETYDLHGDVLDEDGRERTRIYVESKNVDDAGSQGVEFQRFLAQAYSATKHKMGTGNKAPDPKYEFMWATTCPWKGKGFRRVATERELLDAVRWDQTRDLTKPVGGTIAQRVIPAEHEIDPATVKLVACRLWVWVLSERQDEMIPSSRMRGWVRERLARETYGL